MDMSEIVKQARVLAAEETGADKLPEIMRRAYDEDREPREPDYEARDERRRRNAQWSEERYNDPRRA